MEVGVAHGMGYNKLVGTSLRELEIAERVTAIDIASALTSQPTPILLGKNKLQIGVDRNGTVRIDSLDIEIDVRIRVIIHIADVETAEIGVCSVVSLVVENQLLTGIPPVLIDSSTLVIYHTAVASHKEQH